MKKTLLKKLAILHLESLEKDLQKRIDSGENFDVNLFNSGVKLNLLKAQLKAIEKLREIVENYRK